MHTLTTAHPGLLLEVQDRLPLGGGQILFEVRLDSSESVDWVEEIQRLPHVKRVELIEASGRTGTYRVVFSGKTFLPLVRRLQLPRRMPYPVRDGVATWTVVGPEPRIRRLWASLEASGTPFQLEALRRGPLREVAAELTSRQSQILRRAVAEGYFAVPRRVSLSGLAARLGVATSTLSVTLALIEKRIIESHPAANPVG